MQNLDPQVFNISHNGKNLRRDDTIIKVRDGQDVLINLYIPVLGGKGGFGSMLRAIGAQIEKTTNREACRDLAGRRLRDVHTEERIKDWVNKQANRKKKQEERRLQKLKKLSAEPKIEFQDEEYFKTREQLPDQLDDAIEQGLKKASSCASTAIDSKSKVSPNETPTALTPHSANHSTDDKSSDDTGKANGTNESHVICNTDDTNSSKAPHKRKECPDEKNGPKKAPNAAKRIKTALWTGIDEDELSSDEDEQLPAG